MTNKHDSILTLYWIVPAPQFITFANVVGRMLCIHPCLSVCLSVSRITQKVMDRFERNIMGIQVASYPRTIPLNFGGDPDSGSSFRTQNIIFLRSLSTHRVCFYVLHMWIRNEVSLCVERHSKESADISIPLFDTQQWKVLTSACHCLTHNNGKCRHQHAIVWRKTMEM